MPKPSVGRPTRLALATPRSTAAGLDSLPSAARMVHPVGFAPTFRAYRARVLLLDEGCVERLTGFAPASATLARWCPTLGPQPRGNWLGQVDSTPHCEFQGLGPCR